MFSNLMEGQLMAYLLNSKILHITIITLCKVFHKGKLSAINCHDTPEVHEVGVNSW